MNAPWPAQASSMAWPISPPQPPTLPTLTEALLQWDNAKKALEVAKEAELTARKLAFELGFGAKADEGTNTCDLANGYELKGVKKLNYKLVKPKDFKGELIDAVDICEERFKAISNEGSFVAERLFKYDVSLSVSEYRKLVEECEWSAAKKAMLAELNKILEIKEATPTLEIKAPKAAKK